MKNQISKTGAQSPNDLKLSDCGAGQDACKAGLLGAGSMTSAAVRCSAWLGVIGAICLFFAIEKTSQAKEPRLIGWLGNGVEHRDDFLGDFCGRRGWDSHFVIVRDVRIIFDVLGEVGCGLSVMPHLLYRELHGQREPLSSFLGSPVEMRNDEISKRSYEGSTSAGDSPNINSVGWCKSSGIGCHEIWIAMRTGCGVGLIALIVLLVCAWLLERRAK